MTTRLEIVERKKAETTRRLERASAILDRATEAYANDPTAANWISFRGASKLVRELQAEYAEWNMGAE